MSILYVIALLIGTININQLIGELPQVRIPSIFTQVVEPPELPPGEFCATPEHGSNPAHPCACQRHCQDVPKDGEDANNGTVTTVVEDPQCKQYCHKEHCHCPVHNCD